MKKLLIAAAALAVIAGNPAYAQAPGDVFNGSPSMIPGTNAAESALNQAGADPGNFKLGDFTDDEKRMQHKYRDSIKHAKELINKGTSMMDRGKKSNNDKEFKKGKIIKEIGERQLGELNANNPFPSPEPEMKEEAKAETKPEKKAKSKEVAEAATSAEKPKKEKSKFGFSLFGKGKKKEGAAAPDPNSQTTNDQ